MLHVKNISKIIEGNKILSNISLKIGKGEFLAVMGPSGCGKSTLLNCISGIDTVSSGNIFLGERDISKMNLKEIEKMRLEHMGFIFQKINFLKNLSVLENIALPGLYLKKNKNNEIIRNSLILMKKMGIENISKSDIRDISGGQLQRAGICRALINSPEIIFADEPTGALNSRMSMDVMDIFKNIHSEGTSIFMVTHDARVAAIANKVIFMKDGRIWSEVELNEEDENFRIKKILNIMENAGI